MKRFMSLAFVLLFTLVLAAGAVSPALAANQSGATDQPYWYSSIDPSSGQLDNPLADLYQNSAQYLIYNTDGDYPIYILAGHPNYTPDGDDQFDALTTTLVTAIQVYNPYTSLYEDCLVGATFQAPSRYVRLTSAGIGYLQFNVTFTTYDNITGDVVDEPATFPAVYFNVDNVTPPTSPRSGIN